MFRSKTVQLGIIILCGALSTASFLPGEDARQITYFGYRACIELSNSATRVVLCPIGGRVLEFSLQGKNALYLEEAALKKDYAPGARVDMSAGRFDIGPEQTIPRHPQLWSGTWTGNSEVDLARIRALVK